MNLNVEPGRMSSQVQVEHTMGYVKATGTPIDLSCSVVVEEGTGLLDHC